MNHFQGPFSIHPIHIITEAAVRWRLAFFYETPSIFYLTRFFFPFPAAEKENPGRHPIGSVLTVRTYEKKGMESKRDWSGKKWIRKCKVKENSGSNGANGITPER